MITNPFNEVQEDVAIRRFCTRAIRFSRGAYTSSSRACEAKNSNKAFYMSITLQDNDVCAFRLNNIGFD